MDLAKSVFFGNGDGCYHTVTKKMDEELGVVTKKLTTLSTKKGENTGKKHVFKKGQKSVFGNGIDCDLLVTNDQCEENILVTNMLSFGKSQLEHKTQKKHKKGDKMSEFQNSLKKEENILSMEEFVCKTCDYKTTRKWCYNRHMQSKRHLKKIGVMCKICEKQYETKSGLWKHLQKCAPVKIPKRKKKKVQKKVQKTPMIVGTDDSALTKLLMVVLENQQQQQKVQQDLIGTMNKMIPKIGNNNTTNNTINNNQKISIKVFLNEHCKDAVNLKDFVKNIQLTYDNLQQAVRNGGAEAISDVLVQKLTDMKPTERPIHCSDARRSHFYVKDKGEWARDNNTKKLDGAITSIARKQLHTLYQWTQDNPNWINSAKLSNQWQEMTQEIAWTAEEARKYRRKIKRSLMKPTDLKEAMEIAEQKII